MRAEGFKFSSGKPDLLSKEFITRLNEHVQLIVIQTGANLAVWSSN